MGVADAAGFAVRIKGRYRQAVTLGTGRAAPSIRPAGGHASGDAHQYN